MNRTETTWLIPWHVIDATFRSNTVIDELRRELSEQHVLYGLPVQPVAYRQDSDDVLFQLLDSTGRYAVVHLTYAQHPEPNPRWPEAEVFEDLRQFERNRMKIDNKEWEP